MLNGIHYGPDDPSQRLIQQFFKPTPKAAPAAPITESRTVRTLIEAAAGQESSDPRTKIARCVDAADSGDVDVDLISVSSAVPHEDTAGDSGSKKSTTSGAAKKRAAAAKSKSGNASKAVQKQTGKRQ